jgi:hypothetical protein
LTTSINPPSDQCTDEIEASARRAAPGRSIAAITAEVQSPSGGWRTVSMVKPAEAARVCHSRIGEEWSFSRTSTRMPAGIDRIFPTVATP